MRWDCIAGGLVPRTVIWLVAAGAVVLIAALGVAWQGEQSKQSGSGLGAEPAGSTATIQKAVSPPSRESSGAPRPAPLPTTTRPAVPIPTFDVVRIGPDGRAVIAGRAQPGAKVALFDGGEEIAQTRADQNGEWVVIVQEPPLSVGQHELRALQHIEDHEWISSGQVVVAVVPKPPAAATPPKESTLVMVAPPSAPASLVQAPSTGLPKSGDLQMSTLDYDEHGRVTISGQASVSNVVRAYVDNMMVAEGQTNIEGRWRLEPANSVAAGQHKLRLDLLTKDGHPLARLELPFERIIVQPRTGDSRRLVVVHGDSLWNIALAHYGDGMRHTVIFGANKDQIRNPDLIYPGQVFSLPKVN
jgi:hypothetical protein